MSKISELIGDPHYNKQAAKAEVALLRNTIKEYSKFASGESDDVCKKHGEEIVDHPSHYNRGKYECIDIIDDLKLNFNLGSAMKYIWRCGLKDDEITELEKAKWYLEREIANRKANR